MADHSKRKAEIHPESHINKKSLLNDGSSSTPVNHRETISPFKVGKWLPSDREVITVFIKNLITKVQNDPKPLAPVMIELKNLIESNPDVYMYFNLMLSQVPQKYHTNPAGGPQVRDYMVLLELINEILTSSPTFNTTGLVGFPINALLDYSMGTEAGFACFLNDKVNQQLKKVLCEWGKFLCSPESAYVLTPDSGWFGNDDSSKKTFLDTFACDPSQPHYGFKSWDNFFTRHFKEGVRPIDQDPLSIVNACESAPFALVQGVDVRKRNQFWVKGQPYSIQHMLNNDPRVDEFVGGTVYQAFLSALSYHRWHAPVSGRVVSTQVVDGTYYSEAIAEGFDPSAPNDSQGYITELATRGIMYFQADNADIGLMVFIAVGMAEVSSCQFTVLPGQHVNKGEEIGMFHFGGSTHCLLFRNGVDIDWQLGQEPGLNAHNININSKIAMIKPTKKQINKLAK